MPEALLGPSGYLTQRQSRIENLSFITCWRCKGQYQVTYQRHKPNPVYTFELGAFRTLQSLSWKCLDSVKEFRALKAALCVNAERLKKLEIGLYNGPYAYFILSWLRYNDGEKSSCPNFFVREILAVTKPNAEPFFPSLTALSLSDFSFRGGTKELAIAFNVSKLRSLKLDKCPYMGQFLRPVITTYTSPELRIFELTESFCTYEGDEVDGGDGEEVERDIDGSELCPIVGHFLQASTKLEDLFLNVRYVTSATKEYWRFILQHKSSLKRLIYHEREYLTSFEWEGQQKWRDVPFDTSSLSSKRDSEGQLALSCLGISVNFEVVVSSFCFI